MKKLDDEEYKALVEDEKGFIGQAIGVFWAFAAITIVGHLVYSLAMLP